MRVGFFRKPPDTSLALVRMFSCDVFVYFGNSAYVGVGVVVINRLAHASSLILIFIFKNGAKTLPAYERI